MTKNDVTILKKLPSPPEDAKMVLSAVCVLFSLKPDSKMDPNTQKKIYDFWPVAVKMMNKDDFLASLTNYNKDEM